LDIGAQYWIVRLGKNYEYAVVSSPNYHYLWVLYREPKMPEDLYQSIVADLKKDNFPVEKLVRVEQ
jgi:apolipoprotein D and lipocalin family protein